MIDAFTELPEYRLLICGPLDLEPRFVTAFNEALYRRDNIETIGWTDVTSPEFAAIRRRAIATVYPSCSEGGGGSTITCMHAGLVPVVSTQASVDVGDFGSVIDDLSVDAVRRAVQALGELPADQLEKRARAAWEFAREHHTRDTFAADYDRFLAEVVLPEVQRRRASA